MAIINSVTTGNSASSTVAVNVGQVNVGDLVVSLVSYNVAGSATFTITDNSGGAVWTKLTARNSGNNGMIPCFVFATVANANFTVTALASAPNATSQITQVIYVIAGATAYNSDAVNSANFTGTSTAWTVGPTSPAPAGQSIFFYALTSSTAEVACPDPINYNLVGYNGFTAAMKTNAHVSVLNGAFSGVCITGYIISQSAQTPSLTMPAAGIWTGHIFSFSIKSSGGFFI